MKFTEPLKVDFGSNPKKSAFASTEELSKWAQKEADFWTDLIGEYKESPGKLGNLVRSICVQQISPSEQIVNVINQPNPPEESNLLHQLENPLDSYVQSKVLHSDSANGKMVASLLQAATNDSELRKAIFFLGYLNQYNYDLNDAELRSAHLKDFLSGIVVNVPKIENGVSLSKSEQQALEALKADWNEKLLEHERLHAEAVEKYGGVSNQIQETSETQSLEFEDFMTSTKDSFVKLKKFYEEDLRTEAPVTYWSDKARKHRIYQAISGTVFIMGIIAAIWFSYVTGQSISELIVGQETLKELSGTISGQVATTSASNTAVSVAEVPKTDSSDVTSGLLVRVLELVIPFFLIVWLLRIVVKMFLLNSALADDAEERVTMIKTFRSLLEHEDKMDPQDRILMLNALFRPTNAHGDDDGAPPNWFDVLVQRINK